jgi:hypothetical protein
MLKKKKKKKKNKRAYGVTSLLKVSVTELHEVQGESQFAMIRRATPLYSPEKDEMQCVKR